MNDDDFWVELRVADTLTQFPKKFLDVSQEHLELANAGVNSANESCLISPLIQ